MFSVITNIYNKKTKGPALMEFFTATGKMKKKKFLATRDVRCVHHGCHGTHRYDIRVLVTDACKNLNILSMCAVSPVVHKPDISSCKNKKTLFSFPVAVKNPIKLGPLVSLL